MKVSSIATMGHIGTQAVPYAYYNLDLPAVRGRPTKPFVMALPEPLPAV